MGVTDLQTGMQRTSIFSANASTEPITQILLISLFSETSIVVIDVSENKDINNVNKMTDLIQEYSLKTTYS